MTLPDHPRIIRIPAPVGSAPPHRGPSGLVRFLAAVTSFFVAIGLAIAAALAVIEGSQGRVAEWKISSDTLGRDDFTKMALADKSLAIVVQATRNAWATDPGGIFAFSDAEISYYGRLPFISYFDPLAIPLYEQPTPQSLWAALRQRDVRYVLAPQYPLAEVTNTAFGELLADPELTTVVFDHRGTKLIRLADAPLAVTRTLVAEERSVPEGMPGWTFASFGKRGADAPAVLRLADGAVSMTSPDHEILDRRRTDTLYRGAPQNGEPPAFRVDPAGQYRLEIDLEGRGRYDLYAIYLSPTRATLKETWLWNAVLVGRRTAAVRFRPPSEAAVDPDGAMPMGFALRSIGNGSLTVYSWRLEALQ